MSGDAGRYPDVANRDEAASIMRMVHRMELTDNPTLMETLAGVSTVTPMFGRSITGDYYLQDRFDSDYKAYYTLVSVAALLHMSGMLMTYLGRGAEKQEGRNTKVYAGILTFGIIIILNLTTGISTNYAQRGILFVANLFMPFIVYGISLTIVNALSKTNVKPTTVEGGFLGTFMSAVGGLTSYYGFMIYRGIKMADGE